MGKIFYFAYGSNMLIERLTASNRCPSARLVDTACASGYTLAFTKKSTDLSGKATLIKAANLDQYGVLFEIDERELPNLDRAEGNGYGYARDDAFPVLLTDGRKINAITYIATNSETDLMPYDWYLALIVAGLKQHNLPVEQIKALLSTESKTGDGNSKAIKGRNDAMTALGLAGFSSLENVLETELL